MKQMIWDAHTHWMPQQVAQYTSFYKKGWSDIDHLLRRIDRAGIERALLLYPSSDAHINCGSWPKICNLYNREIAKIVRRYNDRLIGAGIMPINAQNFEYEIERIIDMGLSAISVCSSYDGVYLGSKTFDALWEKVARESVAVFVHAQSINPIGSDRCQNSLLMPAVQYLFDITMCVGDMMMAGIFQRFPGLKVVFAHFGGVLPFLKDRFDVTYLMLRKKEMVKDLGTFPSDILRNLYVDISGAKSVALLSMAIDFFGVNRILWGSDFPTQQNPEESILAVKKMGISEGEQKMILGLNLKTLLKREGE